MNYFKARVGQIKAEGSNLLNSQNSFRGETSKMTTGGFSKNFPNTYGGIGRGAGVGAIRLPGRDGGQLRFKR